MTGIISEDEVRRLLVSHPNVSVSKAGHAKHAEKFMAKNGSPIAFEPGRKRFQNLWVRADSMSHAELMDIGSEYYAESDFAKSKPNHDLFGEHAFKGGDLICFKVKTPWEAARVIAAVAGIGPKT